MAPAPGAFEERRDPALRLKRNAVAAWFGVHPADLADLSADIVQIMAARLEGATLVEADLIGVRAEAARWEYLAQTDSLTGLANRRAVEDSIDAEIDRARRSGRPLSLLLADVDGLKDINDRYGHPAGDGVLRTLALRIQRAVRRTDTAGRWGGDEFAIVCPDTGSEAAERVAAKLVDMVESTPVSLPSLSLTVRLSVGWSVLAEHGDPASLLAAADDALYRAKSDGSGHHGSLKT